MPIRHSRWDVRRSHSEAEGSAVSSSSESPCQDTSPKSLTPSEDLARPENLPVITLAFKFDKSNIVHTGQCRIIRRQEVSRSEQFAVCHCVELLDGAPLIADYGNNLHIRADCPFCMMEPDVRVLRMCKYCLSCEHSECDPLAAVAMDGPNADTAPGHTAEASAGSRPCECPAQNNLDRPRKHGKSSKSSKPSK